MAAALKRMTLAEFLDWTPPGDARWELYDGVPVAMAPPGDIHGLLAMTLGTALNNALKRRPPCRARAEAGILSPRGANRFYQADIAVGCHAATPNQAWLHEPILIVEILSPSTEANDRTVKLPDYRLIPSVQEVVLLDSRTLFCEIHRRAADGGWKTDLLVRPEERVILASCGLDVSLAEVYEGIVFAEESR